MGSLVVPLPSFEKKKLAGSVPMDIGVMMGEMSVDLRLTGLFTEGEAAPARAVGVELDGGSTWRCREYPRCGSGGSLCASKEGGDPVALAVDVDMVDAFELVLEAAARGTSIGASSSLPGGLSPKVT
jgi:hypothetical protein